jgi:hypothetical protein
MVWTYLQYRHHTYRSPSLKTLLIEFMSRVLVDIRIESSRLSNIPVCLFVCAVLCSTLFHQVCRAEVCPFVNKEGCRATSACLQKEVIELYKEALASLASSKIGAAASTGTKISA